MKPTLLLFILFLYIAKAHWVDPHSMDSPLDHKPPRQPLHTKREPPDKHCISDVHLRRLVRLILNNAHLEDELGYHKGFIKLSLSPEQYQLLLKFSESSKSEDGVFSEVGSVFEEAFKKPISERYPEMILSFQEHVYNLIFNPASTALFGIFLTLYITYFLIRAQFTWNSIFKFFLIMAYITDVAVTYTNIIREQDIEAMVNVKKLGTVPPECDPQKMSWSMYFKTQLGFENPCKEYYAATYPVSIYSVPPSKIFTRQFKTLIVEPCGDLGEAFGKFGRSLFTSLPWGLNVVIFPIMMVAAIVIIFMIFLFITKSHFKIGLFHLFSLELGQNVQKSEPRRQVVQPRQVNQPSRKQIEHKPRNRKNKNKGEVGLANHRKLVEEVSNVNNSSPEKRKDEKEAPEDASSPSDSSKDNSLSLQSCEEC